MDVQKTMEFILEQQAALTAHQQDQAGAIKDLTVATSELMATTSELKALVLAHESDIQVHTEWLTGISAAMQRLTDQMQEGSVRAAAEDKAIRESLAETRESLAAANAETRENLNILIRTVQDMIPRLPKE